MNWNSLDLIRGATYKRQVPNHSCRTLNLASHSCNLHGRTPIFHCLKLRLLFFMTCQVSLTCIDMFSCCLFLPLNHLWIPFCLQVVVRSPVMSNCDRKCSLPSCTTTSSTSTTTGWYHYGRRSCAGCTGSWWHGPNLKAKRKTHDFRSEWRFLVRFFVPFCVVT